MSVFYPSMFIILIISLTIISTACRQSPNQPPPTSTTIQATEPAETPKPTSTLEAVVEEEQQVVEEEPSATPDYCTLNDFIKDVNLAISESTTQLYKTDAGEESGDGIIEFITNEDNYKIFINPVIEDYLDACTDQGQIELYLMESSEGTPTGNIYKIMFGEDGRLYVDTEEGGENSIANRGGQFPWGSPATYSLITVFEGQDPTEQYQELDGSEIGITYSEPEESGSGNQSDPGSGSDPGTEFDPGTEWNQ